MLNFIRDIFFLRKNTVKHPKDLAEHQTKLAILPTINPENFSVWIKEIIFSDNSRVLVKQNDFVIIVGANNVGKSVTLKEINSLLYSRDSNTKVVKSIETEGHYDKASIIKHINLISRQTNDNTFTSGGYLEGFGFSVSKSTIDFSIQNLERGFSELVPTITYLLSTEDRLTISNPPKNIRPTTQAATHPIHHLLIDEKLESNFSQYFRQAFGTDLLVHRQAGEIVPLYVGDKPDIEAGEDRASLSYIVKLEQLQPLQKQGDGMRSFVGVLLSAFIFNQKILLIDEPEAFLHPPQARLLGKMLAKNVPSGKQFILTTHSGDFLRGALDAGTPNLKIVRLNRSGNINSASVLNNDDIKELWSDSILRHSNILDGLFHSQVIICESDSDNRFYSAVLSASYESSDKTLPDALFTQCGGKHRLPTAIKAFKKLNVPIKVITDFDVLNDVNPLKKIFEELGGNWAKVEKEWKIVKLAIDQKRLEPISVDIIAQVTQVLNTVTERVFPKSKKLEIDSIIKLPSAWDEAKKQGKHYIPNGIASQAYITLQSKFEELGLFIVEVGELEGFVKSVGNHGPKWINEVLEKDLGTDPELETARNFIDKVISYNVN